MSDRELSSRVLALLIVSLSAFLADSVASSSVLLALVGLRSLATGKRPSLGLPEGLVVLASIFLLPSGETPLASLGPVEVKLEGASLALVLALRSTAALWALRLYLWDVPPQRAVLFLAGLKVPWKLSALLWLCFRYLELARSDLEELASTMALRGGRISASPLGLKSLSLLISRGLERAQRRAQRVASAAEMRGFNEVAWREISGRGVAPPRPESLALPLAALGTVLFLG